MNPPNNGSLGGVRLCTKPGCANPAAGKHAWCNMHKAEYQSQYTKTTEEMAFKRGFQAGVEAQRKAFVEMFNRLGIAEMNCMEVAFALDQSPRPVCAIPA